MILSVFKELIYAVSRRVFMKSITKAWKKFSSWQQKRIFKISCGTITKFPATESTKHTTRNFKGRGPINEKGTLN